MRPYCTMLSIVLAVCLCSDFAMAQRGAVSITTVHNLDSRIPIAVPPLSASPDTLRYSRLLADVMAYDLDFTGLFSIVKEFPPQFNGFSDNPMQIAFDQWRTTKTENLVYASASLANEALVIEYRLFDVLASQQIFGKRLRTKQTWSRLLAHQFSDEILRNLTGVPGISTSEICFSAGELGNKEIYIADYDGATITQVTHHGSVSIKPKFSPDGMKIAYLSYKDRFPFLYIYDRRTGVSTPLSKNVGINHAPTWAPNSQTLALCLSKDGNTEIYTKKTDGTGERRITKNRASDTTPTYSPNGKSIAFVSDRGGTPQIYTMNPNGQNVNRISYQGGRAYDPAWSPDGGSIAYCVDRGGNGIEIYVMNADGSNPMRLTESSGINESPTWSPDSRHIAFGSTRTGSPRLYTVTLDSGAVRTIPGVAHLLAEGPNWGPRRKF